jgi:hypothetical protein
MTLTWATWGSEEYFPQVENGQGWVTAYFSTSRELAIVKTLGHFHKYLYGQQFYLRTDHSALTWLLSFKNLQEQTARWVQCLQEYNFTSEHRQGRRGTTTLMHSLEGHAQKNALTARVEQRREGLRVRIITTAAADGWDRVWVKIWRCAQSLPPLMMVGAVHPWGGSSWLTMSWGRCYRKWRQDNARSRRTSPIAAPPSRVTGLSGSP